MFIYCENISHSYAFVQSLRSYVSSKQRITLHMY